MFEVQGRGGLSQFGRLADKVGPSDVLHLAVISYPAFRPLNDSKNFCIPHNYG